MGFDINRFQKKYKELVQEVQQLREKVAHFETEKARVAQDAVAAAVAPMRAELQARSAALHHKERELAVAGTEKQLLADRLAELENQVDLANAATTEAVADRDAWKIKYEGHRAEIDETNRKIDDAVAQLKQYQDKMSRRERERLSALENRKVLAAAMPAPNRRA